MTAVHWVALIWIVVCVGAAAGAILTERRARAIDRCKANHPAYTTKRNR